MDGLRRMAASGMIGFHADAMVFRYDVPCGTIMFRRIERRQRDLAAQRAALATVEPAGSAD